MINKYLLIASVLLSAYVTHSVWQNKHSKLIIELQKAEAARVEAVLKIEELNRQVAEAVEVKLKAEQIAAETKEKIVIKEVIKYVETNPNADTSLDADWLRIHDAAVPVSRDTKTAERFATTDPRVPNIGEALEVVTSNYNSCQEILLKLKAWQDWYRAVQDNDRARTKS